MGTVFLFVGILQPYVYYRPPIHTALTWRNDRGSYLVSATFMATAFDLGPLSLSCCYVGWAMTAQTMVNKRFANSLDQLDTSTVLVKEWHSGPMPLNTILWRCLAQRPQRGTRVSDRPRIPFG